MVKFLLYGPALQCSFNPRRNTRKLGVKQVLSRKVCAHIITARVIIPGVASVLRVTLLTQKAEASSTDTSNELPSTKSEPYVLPSMPSGHLCH